MQCNAIVRSKAKFSKNSCMIGLEKPKNSPSKRKSSSCKDTSCKKKEKLAKLRVAEKFKGWTEGLEGYIFEYRRSNLYDKTIKEFNTFIGSSSKYKETTLIKNSIKTNVHTLVGPLAKLALGADQFDIEIWKQEICNVNKRNKSIQQSYDTLYLDL